MSDTRIRVLSAQDVRDVLTVERAVASQRVAFARMGAGEALLPPRLLVDGTDESVAFCYAARLGHEGPAVSKFGSVNPANTELPVVNAVITVLDPRTGTPVAIMDGTSVTELRTAAASAVAAQTLAPHARRLAVVGAGVQAAAHVRAIALTHDLETVRVWSPTPRRRYELAATLDGELGGRLGHGVSGGIVAASSAEAAVDGADLVVLCTTASEPVIVAEWIADGATVISVGSFTRSRHELGQDVVARCFAVVVDERQAALSDAGPVVAAVDSGLLAASDLVELGEVVTGRAAVRARADGVLYYNSVGVGAQDAAAAAAVVAAAEESGAGQLVVL